MPNISMNTYDTLELTYSVSDNTRELEKILTVLNNGNDQTSNSDLQDAKNSFGLHQVMLVVKHTL